MGQPCLTRTRRWRRVPLPGESLEGYSGQPVTLTRRLRRVLCRESLERCTGWRWRASVARPPRDTSRDNLRRSRTSTRASVRSVQISLQIPRRENTRRLRPDARMHLQFDTSPHTARRRVSSRRCQPVRRAHSARVPLLGGWSRDLPRARPRRRYLRSAPQSPLLCGWSRRWSTLLATCHVR